MVVYGARTLREATSARVKPYRMNTCSNVEMAPSRPVIVTFVMLQFMLSSASCRTPRYNCTCIATVSTLNTRRSRAVHEDPVYKFHNSSRCTRTTPRSAALVQYAGRHVSCVADTGQQASGASEPCQKRAYLFPARWLTAGGAIERYHPARSTLNRKAITQAGSVACARNEQGRGGGMRPPSQHYQCGLSAARGSAAEPYRAQGHSADLQFQMQDRC